jgi:carbamoyl-phosphate synthase large subunit
MGTQPDAIDIAEDRKRFQALIDNIGLKQPVNRTALTTEEALEAAREVGYPVVIRPSFVLGGRGMTIVRDEDHMVETLAQTDVFKISGDDPVLIDQYLRSATEVDVDAIADAEGVFIAGIMEHIEEAGVHSGDSACSIPPWSLKPETIAELKRQATALARELNVLGLMNIQFAIQDGQIYVLEVNPRASRTVPFVAKAVGIPVAAIASRVMAGEKLASFKLKDPAPNHMSVKEAVMPFARFPGVDVVLGPEMKSTGEVMGIDVSFERAFAKSQIAAGLTLPDKGTVFLSVRDADKDAAVRIAGRLIALGFKIIATAGTASHLQQEGVAVTRVNKVYEGRPHIVDAMKDGSVDLVFNTTEGAQALKDSLSIRRTALMLKIPYYTTVAGSLAAVQAIEALRTTTLDVAPLQAYAR